MRFATTCAGLALAAVSAAQLRVATWNISFYDGGRQADIQTVVFSQFQGRSMNPDVIFTQEFISQNAVNEFLVALNAAPESSGTWQAATFVNGPDTDSAMFYRADRLILESTTVVAVGGGAPLPPRNTMRYDVRLRGFLGVGPKVAFYNVHMKSGTTTSDLARRLAEATIVRNDAAALESGGLYAGFALCGDFNIPSSSQGAYMKLTGSEANNAGRLFDPISTPGDWDNTGAFRFIHTQDPSANGGMDSRFDFVLLSNRLRNGIGFDYLGQPQTPYSTTTWNDPNHSYRAWGNDGSSFNQLLTVNGNTMVGSSIAQAIRNTATTGGGHIPVFLDLVVPPEIGATPGSLNFGNIVQGTTPTLPLTVSNSVDTVLWRTGIAALSYSMAPSARVTAPSGTFTDLAGGGGNDHDIGVDTGLVGILNGNVVIGSTIEGVAPRTIPVTANVIPDAIAPDTLSTAIGTVTGGGLPQLAFSDDQRVTWSNANWATGGRFTPVMEATVEAVSSLAAPATMTFEIESQAAGSFSVSIEAFDFVAGAFVPVGSAGSTPFDSLTVANLTPPSRFVQAGTKRMRTRIQWTPSAWTMGRVVSGGIDRVVWKPR